MPPAGIAADPVELNLYPEWREPVSPRRILRDFGGSIAVHAIFAAIFFSIPDVDRTPVPHVVTPELHKAVHLVAPKFFEPTQRAPNQGKVTRELDVRSSVHAPRPMAPKFRPPSPQPGRAAPPTPAPSPVIEPPKIQVATSAPPQSALGANPAVVVPPAPQPEKPKLTFESVGSQSPVTSPNPNVHISPPKTSVQDATRSATQPGGGGMVVGDIGGDLTSVPQLSTIPSPPRIGSNLQLLSDPQGVDFKPYLIQVLNAVRRNWLAIIPESARMGQRGRVLVQFIIDRRGAIPKLVIAEGSGTEAFDRAAVAGISASYPFPPLPADYKGDQIRLQLAFSYNTPNR
jgi:TonB family protein